MPDEPLWPDDSLDAALDRELRALAPLIKRQDALEAEQPDAAFAAALRARLIAPDAARDSTPDAVFARDLREHLVGGGDRVGAASGDIPGEAAPDGVDDVNATSSNNVSPGQDVSLMPRPRGRRRSLFLAGAGVAALVAVLVATIWLPRLLAPSRPSRTAGVASARPPLPSLGNLTRGFNAAPGTGGGGGTGGYTSPVVGAFTLPSSPDPFYAGLHVAVGALPLPSSTLSIYALAPPLGRDALEKAARHLGVAAPIQTIAGSGALWNVATEGSGAPGPSTSLHSLAVSTVTGEMIYYDLRNRGQAGAGVRPLTRSTAIAAARAWLAVLGWSGSGATTALPTSAWGLGEWEVAVNWPGVGAATMPGARLVVERGGRIVEAGLWPRVLERITVPARNQQDALTALRANRIPLSIAEDHQENLAMTGGRATVTRVAVVQVLTADVSGRLYLVPAYRFSGTATLIPARTPGARLPKGPLTATWYALTPATKN